MRGIRVAAARIRCSLETKPLHFAERSCCTNYPFLCLHFAACRFHAVTGNELVFATIFSISA